MLFDFNKPLLDLDGNPVGENLGKLLATALVSANTGDPLQCLTWSLDLYKFKPIELSNADLEFVKALISNTQVLTNLTKGQLIQIINESK
jgi:hypothetical protein